MNTSLKIVFFGTSDFAVRSLDILIENKYDVCAVVTIPDKPQGRGKKILPSPVKIAALKHHIPILQPDNFDDETFINTLKSLSPDVQIVVAFKILPKSIWSIPKFGTVNVHASALPQYRGAAPINWAIINGEKKTGVTTFFIDENVDTGKIAFIEEDNIYIEDTFGTLYYRLKEKGAHLLLKTVKALKDSSCPHIVQSNTFQILKKAPKITKELCEINWEDSAINIYNLIRGLNPIPGAWAMFKNKRIKIFACKVNSQYKLKPKEIKTDKKNFLLIGTKTDPLEITEIQEEGKKSLSIKDFLQGNKIF